jgi:four helix bundle protein
LTGGLEVSIPNVQISRTQEPNKTIRYPDREVFRSLPKTEEARIIGRQMLRSGTSVAANYRAVCRARSKAEFIAKVGVVVEESDETVFWLELLVDTDIVRESKMTSLLAEGNELLAIFAASQYTARQNKARK